MGICSEPSLLFVCFCSALLLLQGRCHTSAFTMTARTTQLHLCPVCRDQLQRCWKSQAGTHISLCAECLLRL